MPTSAFVPLSQQARPDRKKVPVFRLSHDLELSITFDRAVRF